MSLMPSPFHEQLMIAASNRSLYQIDEIIGRAKRTHPEIFVSEEEETLRNWQPQSMTINGGRSHAVA